MAALSVFWTTLPSLRALRMLVVFVPLRATTRRELVLGVPVGAYAAPPVRMALRAADAVPLTVVVPVFVPLRAARGTTRRSDDNFSVRVITLIGLPDCDGVTPGFRSVRIWLFKYGYI